MGDIFSCGSSWSILMNEVKDNFADKMGTIVEDTQKKKILDMGKSEYCEPAGPCLDSDIEYKHCDDDGGNCVWKRAETTQRLCVSRNEDGNFEVCEDDDPDDESCPENCKLREVPIDCDNEDNKNLPLCRATETTRESETLEDNPRSPGNNAVVCVDDNGVVYNDEAGDNSCDPKCVNENGEELKDDDNDPIPVGQECIAAGGRPNPRIVDCSTGIPILNLETRAEELGEASGNDVSSGNFVLILLRMVPHHLQK